MKIIITAINIILIVSVTRNNAYANWITVFIIFFVSLFDFLLGRKYSSNKRKAERLRQIEFDYRNLHVFPHPADLTKLYLNMPKKFHKNPELLHISFDSNYFENENTRFNLLENIFLTCQNFKKNLNTQLKYALFLSVFIIAYLIIFFIFFTLSIDPFSIKSYAPKIFLVVVTSFITYNFIEVGFSFHDKARQLERLFTKLAAVSGNSNKVISYLIEYNSILNDSYSTSTKIYKKNYELFKSAWAIKKQEILSNISIEKITDELKNNFKTLLVNTLNYNNSILIGSYSSNLEIAGKSDLDILLVFDNENNDLRPKELFDIVYEKFKLMYGDYLKLSIPSLIIQNFNDLVVEITPCIKKDDSTYQILGENNDWEDIQPHKIKNHFDDFDKKSNGKFYKILKKVKAWKYEEEIVLIHSVYLQTLLYYVMKENEITSEQDILLLFFERLSKLEEIKNPLSDSNIIKPSKLSNELKSTFQKKIDTTIRKTKTTSNG